MRSYRIMDETDQQQLSQVFVLNAERKTEAPSRFIDSVQKSFTVSYEPAEENTLPRFDQPAHSFPILNTIPAKSTVLGITLGDF